MPPKPKEAPKKATPTVVRQPISTSSLVVVPDDVIEGFEERLEVGIDWTLITSGIIHHKFLCQRENIPKVTFTEALEKKISRSIMNDFLNEESGLTLEQSWEFLPAKLWENEKFANEEGKICFHNYNCITNDLEKMIKKSVKAGNRNKLRKDLKMVNLLRVNDTEMTELDEGLLEFKNLVSLNLCINFISNLNTDFIPPTVRTLELQSNRISDMSGFAEFLPFELMYLGLAKNFITTENVGALGVLPFNLTVLDLSDNDIYHLEPVLDALVLLQNLNALQLAGNPCSVCAGYARATLTKLSLLRWLDSREILETDRPLPVLPPIVQQSDIHPDDLRSANFVFTVFRVMSIPQPPKPEKGVTTTFHVELEIPKLDVVRRKFLMFRRNESLTEMLPPPEDEEWLPNVPSEPGFSKAPGSLAEASSQHASDIYTVLVPKNPLEVHHFTTFETNRVQWNKMINFQEPALKIFCPDLIALRDTFRSVITVRLIYTVTHAPQKAAKQKSTMAIAAPGELRVTIATIRCALKSPDWSQPSQHFHWDETLGTNDAIHWGEGDLSVLQYSQVEKAKQTTKGKSEGTEPSSRQLTPDNLTCHFSFGIDTLPPNK